MEHPISLSETADSTDQSDFMKYATDRLNRLRVIEDGWNGPKSKAPTHDAITAVGDMLGQMSASTLFPSFSITNNGGVTAEWHVAGALIVIEADETGALTVDATTPEGENILGGDLDDNNKAYFDELIADMTQQVEAVNPGWRQHPHYAL